MYGKDSHDDTYSKDAFGETYSADAYSLYENPKPKRATGGGGRSRNQIPQKEGRCKNYLF